LSLLSCGLFTAYTFPIRNALLFSMVTALSVGMQSFQPQDYGVSGKAVNISELRAVVAKPNRDRQKSPRAVEKFCVSLSPLRPDIQHRLCISV
jgi:hypothetical protein